LYYGHSIHLLDEILRDRTALIAAMMHYLTERDLIAAPMARGKRPTFGGG
jgi:hypothetical protein